MATYVLVGGAWLGAWAWRDVARGLRAKGHDVYPLTLTGLGDRAHLASPDVNLDTHTADIVNTLASEDLQDVVLLAHSYSTMPVTAAADRARERIGKLVYLDCAPLPNGMPFVDGYQPVERQFVERLVAEQGDGWRLPLPSWEKLQAVLHAGLEGISEPDLSRFRARAVPHPFGTWTQPFRLAQADAPPPPKLAILCSFSEAEMRQLIASGHPWGREMSGPEWRFAELRTSHWPMFSRPDELTDILHAAAPQ